MDGADKKIEWHQEILPRATKRGLLFLSQQHWLQRSRWYLAGGTALALQEGHRQSVDLDFFIPTTDFSVGKILQHFSKTAWMTTLIKEGTLYGTLYGAKVSFIAYPFFYPKEKMHRFGAVRVLSSRDIAVMKIVTISQRGRKRDFMDLHWYLCHHESLEDVLRRLPQQYPTGAQEYQHILKSLVYFKDAEEDPMPKMLRQVNWRDVKKYFQLEVPAVAKKFLHLE